MAQPKRVIMTPRTVDEVERAIRSRTLWRLGAASINTCKRIVQDAIDKLPEFYCYPSQASEYGRQKAWLERLLNQLGE